MIREIILGPLVLHMYGLVIGLAIVAGWWWAEKQARAGGVLDELFERVALWAVVGGVIGARFYHVIDVWDYYREHLLEIIAVWNGGLGIWGAVMGGAFGIFIATLHNPTSRIKILDAGAMALPLSQAIGRWGNYVNYELFGKPTNLPWAIFIPPEHRPKGITATHFHPLFLYESLANLLLFGIILLLKKRGVKFGLGKFVGAYLIGYGVIRMVLEPLRITVWQVGEIPTAQLVSIVSFGLGMILLKK